MATALDRTNYAADYSERSNHTSPACNRRRNYSSRRSLVYRSLDGHISGINSQAIQSRSEPVVRRLLLFLIQTLVRLHIFGQARRKVGVAHDNIFNALAELIATFGIRLEGIHYSWTRGRILGRAERRQLRSRLCSILCKS